MLSIFGSNPAKALISAELFLMNSVASFLVFSGLYERFLRDVLLFFFFLEDVFFLTELVDFFDFDCDSIGVIAISPGMTNNRINIL